MDAVTLAGVAARRSAMYWLQAELLLACPNEARIARLRRDLSVLTDDRTDHPLAKDLSALLGALPSAEDAAGIIRLAVEYTRLFGGIGASYGLPAPYESVHRRAAEAADLVAAVTRDYLDAGLAAIDEAAPPDHVGVELKFLALLCHGENAAWRGGREAVAVQALGRQRRFLDDHLLQWAPAYWELVRDKAQHQFFRSLAALAHLALVEDRALIGEILVGIDAA